MPAWIKKSVITAVFLAMLFLWAAAFCYVIPSVVDNRFSQIVSIGVGAVGVLPWIIGGGWAFISRLTGKKQSRGNEPAVCPHCGQLMPDESPNPDRGSAA